MYGVNMKPQSLLIVGVLAVAAIAILVLLPGTSAPAAPEPVPVPGKPTPVPVPENGTYVNTTYGYALTCPEGWFYTESERASGSPPR